MNLAINKVFLGKIVSTHGVKGYFKIKFYCKSEIDFLLYKNFFMIEENKIDISKKFSKGKLLICSSSQISNKSEALVLVGKEIWIKEQELKKNSFKEYFYKDLINCLVIDNSNVKLGRVKAVHNFGAGDLLELDGDYKYMIRFADLKEENIDTKNKIIIYHQSIKIY
jgi:16S rRNA processing protein RimM